MKYSCGDESENHEVKVNQKNLLQVGCADAGGDESESESTESESELKKNLL